MPGSDSADDQLPLITVAVSADHISFVMIANGDAIDSEVGAAAILAGEG